MQNDLQAMITLIILHHMSWITFSLKYSDGHCISTDNIVNEVECLVHKTIINANMYNFTLTIAL